VKKNLKLKKRWEKFVQVNREQLLLVSDSLERINSEIPLLEEQTRLLLNHPRWEFPRDRIILGIMFYQIFKKEKKG